MQINSFALKSLAVATLFAAAGTANAAITVYTSQAAFLSAVGTTGTDTFAGLSITSVTPSPITRSAGSFSYTATPAPAGGFFGAGTTTNPWLSTNTSDDVITFNGFSAGVVAAGGNFFGSDEFSLFAAGSVTLTATDGSGTTTQTITGATVTSFLGFVSNGPLLSMTLVSVQPASSFLWPTADNLMLASAVTAVPETQTYAMMLAGLGVLGFMARRRRG